jgi:hypothetical protein
MIYRLAVCKKFPTTPHRTRNHLHCNPDEVILPRSVSTSISPIRQVIDRAFAYIKIRNIAIGKNAIKIGKEAFGVYEN